MPYKYNASTGKYELVQEGPPNVSSNLNPLSSLEGTALKVHPEDQKRILGDMGQMAGTVGEIASGFVPGGAPIRMAVSGLTGAASNAMRGEDPLTGAGMNMGLQGFGELLTKAPSVMNRLALILGGMDAEGAKRGAGAFAKENQGRLWKIPGTGEGPLHVGANRQLRGRLGEAGKLVEATREADPTMHDIAEVLGGFSDDLQTKGRYSADPLKSIRELSNAEQRRIYSHMKLREQEMFDMVDDPLNPSKGPGFTAHNPPGDTKVFGSNTQEKLGNPSQPKRIGEPDVTDSDVDVIDMEMVRRTPKQTTSEMRKIETNLKHSRASDNLRNAKEQGGIVSADDLREGKLDQAMADRIRKAAYEGEGVGGPMQRADERYANLSEIGRANEAVRFPNIFAEPGKMAARGGLGAGIGGVIGGLMGGIPGGIAGGLLGPLVLAPNTASHLGTLMGRSGTVFPAAARGAESYLDMQERKRKTQMRKPK